MNDLSTRPTALIVGQIWRPQRGPWASNKYTARVLDLQEGWVRFFVNDAAPDERMPEVDFRSHYTVLVSDSVEPSCDETFRQRFESWATDHNWRLDRRPDGQYRADVVQMGFVAYCAGRRGE